MMMRGQLVNTYCFTVPCPHVLEWTKTSLPQQQLILDPLAGTGYWACMLAQQGFHVSASDAYPVDAPAKNFYHSKATRSFHPVELCDAEEAVRRMNAKKIPYTLLLSWPPYEDDLGARLVDLTEASHLLYIGEDIGGCCGTDNMFHKLDERYVTQSGIKPWQFPAIHDYVTLYCRK
jgi:hypothetical protein